MQSNGLTSPELNLCAQIAALYLQTIHLERMDHIVLSLGTQICRKEKGRTELSIQKKRVKVVDFKDFLFTLNFIFQVELQVLGIQQMIHMLTLTLSRQ